MAERIYWGFAVVGVAVPMAAFLPWLGANGPDASLFVSELFSTQIGTFFGLDVIVSALVLFVFIFLDEVSVRRGWLAVPATLLVGVSFGLPLYLAMRERAKKQ